MCALRMVNRQTPGTNHAMTLFCQDSVLEITRYINFLLDCTQPYRSGSLSDGDGNENGKKEIGLISKTTTLHALHAFLYISVVAGLRRETS